MSTQQELLERHAAALMNAFGSPKRVLVRGSGAHVWDADGRRYTDLLAGIAVNSLGHAHPAILAAVTEQFATLGHISNLFASEPQIRLAERLVSAVGGGRVFFTNSGAEANEAAFKIARLTGRTRVIAMENSFHGRTMGALALTHTPRYREPFEPLPGGVEFVPFGDLDALEDVLDDTVAAVVMEPIQGESGVIPASAEHLAAVRGITARHGVLLWLDEVQTGIGRCGELLLGRSWGIDADLVTVAKGLGGGFPVGACIATGAAAELLTPGMHGSTFGGNPMAAAVGNAVLDVLEDGLLEQVRRTGAWLTGQIEGLGHRGIVEVRGTGLLLGLVLAGEVAPMVADLALADGWLLNAPRPDVLRLAPPLVITPEELAPFVAALPGWLERAGA
ncbi:acetylornithine transaminase [Arachnia propionica]|uniref:Acetylornithine aminotransferase n=1 Tax=Arachnia propionica TaxID=1750 RepID=A0A3P1T1D0_9ACTN|nr:acetylornithine transaminase [Arachnia propionica]RRD03154.1 acetylornithine transaminase [Arachnia propionica]